MERKNKKTKQVGNGEGTLYKSEKLNCWIFQYYDTDGKRKTVKQKKNEKTSDFKAKVTEIKNSLNNGIYVGKSNETVISIAKHFINQKYEDGVITGRTYKRDMETLNELKKTCSNFCDIPIQQVTIQHIENAKKEMKKYANSVIDKIWMLLKKVFKLACSPSRKILIFNIIEDETLKKPISNIPTKKVKPLSKTEYQKLIKVLDNEERNHKYRNIVKMQIISGMRISEVLARSENDYNEQEQTFNIYNTLTQDENYNIIWSEHTKTYNKKTGIDEGQRYLPLNNILFSEIINIIKEEKAKKVISIKNIHNTLFWNYDKDKFVYSSEVNAWLRRITKKYNIKDDDDNENITTHRLRHYTISYWRRINIPLEVIQYLAGHVEGSDITSDVYIDTSFDFVKDTLNKIS